ncbi:MAG: GNAT family N-acetyltransferase [Bacteroidetes bacterium]|nr:GNAT family N-acetyltransferase [Bacteroidota bacterium]MBL6944086.1 GNAT family N-acetyltransferase [Bacteroidales bacterium]
MKFPQNKEVKLRPLELPDVEKLAALANNRNISVNLRDGFPHPYTTKDAKAFIEKCIGQNPTTTFAIEYKGNYIGNIGLVLGTDVYNRSAEIGYFLGEQFWNKGIMTMAVNLITNYGFEILNLVRIHTGIFDYNLASVRVLEKCGFQKEGVFKRAVFKNGKFNDEIRFAKLRTDQSSL